MALTNLSQITTSGISTLADINLNNITGVAATFTGNVTVGGTLTYDDVTNIDSVGLITARSGLSITSGDLTLPDSIIHAGDTNTKIRFPAADTITAETGGTERLRITSDGRVAVNFTNPDSFNLGAKFIVKQTGADITSGTADNSSNTKGIHLYQDSNDDKSIGLWFTTGAHMSGISGQRSNSGSHWGTDLRFYTHTANTSNLTQAYERLRITSGGSVGIGTDAPANKLSISDPGYTGIELQSDRTTATDNIGGLHFRTLSTNVAYIQSLVDGTVRIRNTSSLTERLRIDSAGRLGIGGNGIGNGLGVYLQRSSPNTTHFYEASDGTKTMITGVDSTNDYVKIGSLSNHRVGLVANNGEKISILPSGNIGIGQASPTKKLEVASGAVSFSPDTAGKHTHEFTTNASNDGRYFIKSDTTTKVDIQANGVTYFNGGKVIVGDSASDLSGTHTFMACGSRHAFQHDGNTGTYLSFTLGSADGDVDIEADARSGGYPDLTFTTNNDKRLRITSDGKVGINQTDIDADLHIATAGSSEEDGTLKIGGSENSLGLSLTYDQAGATVSKITANPTYTNNSSLLKICVDGDGNPDQLVLSGAGKIGINQLTPTAFMHVKSGANDGTVISTFEGATNNKLDVKFISSGPAINVTAGDPLVFEIGGSEKLRITSGGVVGINTTTGFDTSVGLAVRNGASGSDHTMIDIIANTNETSRLVFSDDTDHNQGRIQYNHIGNSLAFYTNGNNEKLRIASDGSVGINETSPNRRLYISGSESTAYSSSSGSNNAYLRLHNKNGSDNTGVDNHVGIEFYVANGATTVGMLSMERTGNNIGDFTYKTRTGASTYAEHFRITSEGHKWTVNGSLFHGSGDYSDFIDASRNSYNNVSIRAGYPGGDSSPTNRCSAIKIYPAGSRNSTAGTLTGGIAWQHLDPNNGAWGTSYGAGAQIWMGAALNDTAGQERDRFNLWMNNQTSGNTNPNNLAIEAYPNGIVRHPKVPSFLAIGGTALVSSQYTIIVGSNTEFNNGGHYSTSNGRFTAPINGIYHFTFWGLLYSYASGVTTIYYSRNGTQYGHLVQGGAETNSHTSRSGTIMMSMSAGDYAELRINRGTGSHNAYGSQWNMCGFLVG